jgi:hypothetical protein
MAIGFDSAAEVGGPPSPADDTHVKAGRWRARIEAKRTTESLTRKRGRRVTAQACLQREHLSGRIPVIHAVVSGVTKQEVTIAVRCDAFRGLKQRDQAVGLIVVGGARHAHRPHDDIKHPSRSQTAQAVVRRILLNAEKKSTVRIHQ